MSKEDLQGLRRLLAVMEQLRDPEDGCPWDREQTARSIAPWTIEEACEVAAAVEEGDATHWREELGDLLFHVVFHARLAEEQDEFDFDAVAGAAAAKLEQRHPHVFAGAEVPSMKEFNRSWEAAKSEDREHIDDHLPAQLPALMRALKLQKRAASLGFDWPDKEGPRGKIHEELSELEASDPADAAALREEVGDLLFAVVNLARHLNVEPEQALREANRKFTRRFNHIESRLAEQGVKPRDTSLEQLDALWDEAKALERREISGGGDDSHAGRGST
ncbi:MAG: nucleoside triphosphate pyrophosphohydrolase [Gammaproteobacteria bacterium]